MPQMTEEHWVMLDKLIDDFYDPAESDHAKIIVELRNYATELRTENEVLWDDNAALRKENKRIESALRTTVAQLLTVQTIVKAKLRDEKGRLPTRIANQQAEVQHLRRQTDL